jgi:AcrR family transcriptional regulator/transcriptional regulator with XRE-family HTH domain
MASTAPPDTGNGNEARGANGAGHAGARVRAARVDAGMTLRVLAREIGVSPATVSQIENGKTRLTVTRLADIAHALGTDPSAILAAPVVAPPPAPPAREPLDLPTASPAVATEPGGWRSFGPLAFDPVLSAALSEFLRAGYHGASIRAIAKKSGLSVPGLYHHYESKQQMLHRILDHTMRDLLARSTAARDEGRDAVERFSLLVECLALYHTHRRDLAFVGASEMRSLEPRNRAEITAMRNAQQRMVDREAEAAAAAGLFATPHPHEAARAVTTMCVALANWYRADGRDAPEEIARRYVRFALDLMGHTGAKGRRRSRATT